MAERPGDVVARWRRICDDAGWLVEALSAAGRRRRIWIVTPQHESVSGRGRKARFGAEAVVDKDRLCCAVLSPARDLSRLSAAPW